jgi:hypothetical protein
MFKYTVWSVVRKWMFWFAPHVHFGQIHLLILRQKWKLKKFTRFSLPQTSLIFGKFRNSIGIFQSKSDTVLPVFLSKIIFFQKHIQDHSNCQISLLPRIWVYIRLLINFFQFFRRTFSFKKFHISLCPVFQTAPLPPTIMPSITKMEL